MAKKKKQSNMKKWIAGVAALLILIFTLLGAYGIVDLVPIDNMIEAVTGQRIFTEADTGAGDSGGTDADGSDDGAVVEPATVEETSTDGDFWAVYFTTPGAEGNHIERNLINYINAANETIHISSFEFNLDAVAEALVAAHERGVEVQWVTDDEHGLEADEEDGHGQFAMLEKAGVEIKDDSRSALMHNKFWIFDGEMVWTGSTNITSNGTMRNNNNVIVVKSPALAVIYEVEFQEMWTDGKHGITSPSTVGQQKVQIDGTTIYAFFAAEDDVADKMVTLINSADSSIYFMAFSFTHDEMGAAMIARGADNVQIAGIFEKRGSQTEYSEMTALFCAGYNVRQDGNPRTFHHKAIVIDESIVITGSFNFSENADKSNDENVLVIENAEIAALYIAEFERRWSEAEVPIAGDDVICP